MRRSPAVMTSGPALGSSGARARRNTALIRAISSRGENGLLR